MIIMDASAAIDIALQNPNGLAIHALIRPDERVDAPIHFRTEVCSVIWKYIHIGKQSYDAMRSFQQKALALVDEYHRMDDLEDEVMHEAVRLDHSPCDIFYLVLARRMDATLFTLDKRLRVLAEQMGVDCVHLVDLQS